MRKEIYYSKKNATQKIAEWEEVCKEIKRRKPFEFSLNNAALLVIDMQNIFLSQDSHAFIPSSPYIILNIHMLMEKFASKNRPILFSRHIMDASPGNLMNEWWSDLIRLEDKKSEITEDLDTSLGKIIVKHQYSAFHGSELDATLRKKGVSQVVITGVLTHLCCESTAREAFMRGYQVFFPFDATATYNEILHLGAIRSIAHGFGICVSTKNLL
ncbi:MAG: isochorismatase family protein [Promethearchaeota archaeon]|nr:MAG: isochorismatase family protein [Candidatus Lokiarchaeota archaeon]